ncbi:hypothetical protein HPB50_001279 [Hyalomma asiaticum]|uniref:Uncharacterized protein n=1 Tax=Hyalomma asiaticum TaxID=266040 RepID=A0ACB7RLD5_HYAAI|nr:hypothetical protein HPB50_001279 [Hyalomma asiaticum]
MNHEGAAVTPGGPSRIVLQPFQPFKTQPFHCVMAQLVRPTRLTTRTYTLRQYRRFQFFFEEQHVNDIESSLTQYAGGIREYSVQVHLRLCLADASSEQGDSYPTALSVHVNGRIPGIPKPIKLKVPGSTSGEVGFPINIVTDCFLSHLALNTVCIGWNPVRGQEYAVGVFLVRKLSVATLLGGVQQRIHDTRELVKQTMNLRGSGDDVAVTRYPVSLLCPLTKTRINLPCRALSCTHLECFDAFNYLQINEQRPRWVCPVCGHRATYASLYIDRLFVGILRKAPGEVIVFQEDGSWTSSEEHQDCASGTAASATQSSSCAQKSTSAPECSRLTEQTVNPTGRPNVEVVDLT